MKYVVPLFDGVLCGETQQQFFCGCKYLVKNVEKPGLLFDSKFNFCSVLDFNNLNENVLYVSCGEDVFYFLMQSSRLCGEVVEMNFKNKRYLISMCGGIKITQQGKWICDLNVDNLKYSHYEEIENILILYFSGERRFVVAIKEAELEYFGYIDECNIKDDEKYFLEKQHDSLNHGKVFHVAKGVCEKYLVYLDDNELCLKDEFLPIVFLDCVKVKNLNYARALTNLDFKDNSAFSFFPEYDFFYPVSKSKVILLNKNTLAGICEFEIKNSKIENIVML